MTVLKPGDSLPPLSGLSVTGKPLDLSGASKGTVSVLIFAFSRAGGRDAHNWSQHLAEDRPNISVYTAIFLESVPVPFRSIAVSSIRSGMPATMQDHTLLLYQEQSSWEERLQVTDKNHASVLVLGQTGFIQWISDGPFSDLLYARLKHELEPSRSQR
jgi:hypothetical protein